MVEAALRSLALIWGSLQAERLQWGCAAGQLEQAVLAGFEKIGWGLSAVSFSYADPAQVLMA